MGRSGGRDGSTARLGGNGQDGAHARYPENWSFSIPGSSRPGGAERQWGLVVGLDRGAGLPGHGPMDGGVLHLGYPSFRVCIRHSVLSQNVVSGHHG